MALTATFDLGTTALKCAVLDENQKLVFSDKEDLTTYTHDGLTEQDPEEWWSAFCRISSRFDKKNVDSIIFSGQMQDIYFIDGSGMAIGRASLYTDPCGSEYVDRLPPYIAEKTSIAVNGTIPVTKFGWYRDHAPEVLEKAQHVLFGAKDYILLKLTGRYVSDVTNMSTTGLMDIRTLGYVDTAGIVDKAWLPEILHSDEIVGKVISSASEATGFLTSTDVFAGSGDAGATTLASGISRKGELNVNLGTTGWIAAVSDGIYEKAFNLAAINRGLYINVVPIFNGASVHNWISRFLFGDDSDRYTKLHNLLSSDTHANPDLLCLPYLVGERFPVSDTDVRGAYYGFTPETTSSDMARSSLEGVAFSLKQGLELMGIKPMSLSLIGGGAAERIWCQIFSNIFNTEVTVFGNSDILPSMALSSVVQFGRGKISSYAEYIERILKAQSCTVYTPQEECVEHYRELYERFKMLYPSVKGLKH